MKTRAEILNEIFKLLEQQMNDLNKDMIEWGKHYLTTRSTKYLLDNFPVVLYK